MKRLFKFVILLFLLAILGSFAWFNNQKVAISLLGSFTVQFSLWTVIFGCMFLGALLMQVRFMFKYPSHLFQSINREWKQYTQKRQENLWNNFYQSCFLRQPEQAKIYFQKLPHLDKNPYVHLEFLSVLQFQLDSKQLLKQYAELYQRFPENLGVILAYQKVALEAKELQLARQLLQEGERLFPDNPKTQEGWRDFAVQQQDWKICLEQERMLLNRFPKTHFAIQVAEEHEQHLQKTLQQNPDYIEENTINLLKGTTKEQGELYQVLLEAEQMQKQGRVLHAAKKLSRAYLKLRSFEILQALEKLYKDSGKPLELLETLKELHEKAPSQSLTLLYAKWLYWKNQFSEVRQVLQKITAPQSQLPSTYHKLCYFLALQNDQTLEALEASRCLITEENL